MSIDRFIRWLDGKLWNRYYLSYGRDIVRKWSCEHLATGDMSREFRVLDIGVGSGEDIANIRQAVPERNIKFFGVEYYEPNIVQAQKAGIEIFAIDIERDRIPVEDGFFDVIIANQVIEHTKELFWIFSELSRVLQKGGILIVGIPNLASLQGRLLLLLGRQPMSIQLWGAHVRGITKQGFTCFAERGGYFKVSEFRGSNFLYLPRFLNSPLATIFPNLTGAIFFKIHRTETEGVFLDLLQTVRFETPYFTGTSG